MSHQPISINGVVKDRYISGQNSEGVEFRGTLLRMTRMSVVFELHNPAAVLRFSESLAEFKIVFNDRPLYSGKAVVRNLMSTGPSVVICEATLNENSWTGLDVVRDDGRPERWRREYQNYLEDWQKLYKVRPEYKLVVADMHSYFADLRLWLDQIELGIRALPVSERQLVEEEALKELIVSILPFISDVFDQLETVIGTLESNVKPAHQVFLRRQLHPLLLCSPFAWRTFQKPLGYAGDYEMVNMITRNAPEGASLYAKLIHTWFVRQAPAVAHRNRIDFLVKKISEEILRTSALGRDARIFNFACGPAMELQQFLTESPLRDRARFTLLDFNEETLNYVRTWLGNLASKQQYHQPVNYIKKSVHHVLKESIKTVELPLGKRYDLVYCAGLFDYLSDNVCQRIMDVMYEWVAPGGVLVATNVDPSNPRRNGMEHLLDWYLIYRTGSGLKKLKPSAASPEEVKVYSDHTGVNVYLEVRKPYHV